MNDNYLNINNLSFEYPDGHEALKNINLNLSNGERLGVLGPNGAGKTTLILHLNGILGELKGNIQLNQVSYTEDNISKIRKSVGLVFQDPDDQLFMPTVLEDVMFGPKNFGFSEEQVEANSMKALEQVKMLEFIDKPPHHLSFGQKRKMHNRLPSNYDPK